MAGPLDSTNTSEDPSRLPPDPEVAFVLGILFQQLGGDFAIDSNGKRYIGRGFEPVAQSAIPQLTNTPPHRQFLNVDQWEGAMRVIETGLSALHPDDKAFLFDAFATCTTDPRKPFDFREQLR
jgi:hypothetical protein